VTVDEDNLLKRLTFLKKKKLKLLKNGNKEELIKTQMKIIEVGDKLFPLPNYIQDDDTVWG